MHQWLKVISVIVHNLSIYAICLLKLGNRRIKSINYLQLNEIDLSHFRKRGMHAWQQQLKVKLVY